MDSVTSTGMILGFVGVSLSLASCAMKNMQALRQVSLVCNVVFVTYGILEMQWPTIVLNSILFPINAWRLYQIKRLVRDIEQASSDSPLAEWLLPNMDLKFYPMGTVIFEQGDPADAMYVIQSGEILLREYGKTLGQGELFGEIGLFAPDGKRTASVVCQTDCLLYSMTRETAYKLYYQQPKLAFLLMNLIVARLMANAAAHRATD